MTSAGIPFLQQKDQLKHFSASVPGPVICLVPAHSKRAHLAEKYIFFFFLLLDLFQAVIHCMVLQWAGQLQLPS